MAVSLEELQLAARNHGMPLEALRYDVTPVGLHYLLIHFDVPEVPEDWRLHIGGEVERELSLSVGELRARPSVRRTVTMECAGNGGARLEAHVVSQPWVGGGDGGVGRSRAGPAARGGGRAGRSCRGAVQRPRPRHRRWRRTGLRTLALGGRGAGERGAAGLRAERGAAAAAARRTPAPRR